MCKSIHTGCSLEACRHRGHHIRVYDCDDRYIVGIDTDKFSLVFRIRDDIVDGNLCRSPCCCRYGYDRNTGILCRSHSLKTPYILKLRIGYDYTDSLGCIHWGSAAYSNYTVRSAFLECLYSGLHVFYRGIRLDIWIKLIRNACCLQLISHLFCHIEFYQIRIRWKKYLLEPVSLDLLRYGVYSALSMIRCFVKHKTICHFYPSWISYSGKTLHPTV